MKVINQFILIVFLFLNTNLIAQNEVLKYSNNKIYIYDNQKSYSKFLLPTQKIDVSGNFSSEHQFINVKNNRVLFDIANQLFVFNSNTFLIISLFEYCHFDLVIDKKKFYKISNVTSYMFTSSNNEKKSYVYILHFDHSISHKDIFKTGIWAYFYHDIKEFTYSISHFNLNDDLTLFASLMYRDYFINQFNLYFTEEIVEEVEIPDCRFFSRSKFQR